jgi:hypothetical protein
MINILQTNTKQKLLKILKYTFLLLILNSHQISHGNSVNNNETTIQVQFNELFEHWKKSIKNYPLLKLRSNPNDYIKIQEFQLIYDMGIRAIPSLFSVLEEESENLYSACLVIAVENIAKVNLRSSVLNDSLENRYKRWWKSERAATKNRFETLYTKWKQTESEKKKQRPFTVTSREFKQYFNDDENAIFQWMDMPEGTEKERLRPFQKTVYQQLLDLGVVAIPYAIEKINAGELELIDAVNYWTDNALQNDMNAKNVTQDKTKEFCVDWWNRNQEKWSLPLIETEPQ